jgi:hypothetical protein
MKFFNKKEDVIDIQLTRYGRKQMSEGGLRPKYYAFFDDNVLYDTEYAGFVEDQNSSEPRVQEDTVNLKTQAIFEGSEFRNKNPETIQSTTDRHYSLTSRLGNSSLNSEYRPSWDIRFLKGEITGSAHYATGSHQTLMIPQLDIDVTYETFVYHIDQNPIQADPEGAFMGDLPILRSRVFADGTYLQVKQDMVLLDVFEANTEFDIDNVTIEIFEVESVDVSGSIRNLGAAASEITKKKVLKPLKFVKEFKTVQNNLLVPENEMETSIGFGNPEYVGYYFDLLVDKEIPNDLLCSGINNLRSRGVDIDYSSYEFDCPEKPPLKTGISIYASDMKLEDVDSCEDV